MTELYQKTIHELHGRLKRGEITSREITESVLKRINKVEGKIHAYITRDEDLALKQADIADKRISKGAAGILTGIPIAIKDLICTQGIKTTCASKILESFIPPYDASVVKRLKKEDAIFIGKTNMDEFAMGSSTETSCFGATRNPWDLTRVPGGSSGGSAACVCADGCIAALGSDTGGSIRQPAAFCGIVGMKPTYGRVSRFGLVAFASSLDQIGPMTKDVEDCALLLNIISGYDPYDSTSVPRETPDYTKSLINNVSGIKIGFPKEYFREGIDPETEQAVHNSIKLLEELGATCKEVSLPHTDYAVSVYYLIAPAEASSNLARYDGVKYGFRSEQNEELWDMYRETRKAGFGVEVKRRIMLGTYALSSGYYDAYYKKASQVRTLIINDFQEVFKECQVLITPTAPTPAFKIGEKVNDPLNMYLSDIFTVPVNLAGLPGISLPGGFSEDGLPIGVQFIGKHFEEETLLQVAYTLEKNTDYHLKRPNL